MQRGGFLNRPFRVQDSRYRLSTMVLLGFGLVCAIHGVAHWFSLPKVSTRSSAWVLLESAILLAFSVPFFYTGFATTKHGFSERDNLQVISFAAGGAALGVLLSTFILTTQIARHQTFAEMEFIFFISIEISSGLAAVGGFYFVDQRRQTLHVNELQGRLSILLRVLRHNLRNELAVIQGHLPMALENPRHLQTIETHLDQLESLTEKGKHLHEIWEVDTSARIDLPSTVEKIATEAAQAHPNATIRVDADAAVDEVTVHPKFDVVIREAIENASEHNDDVEVDVTVDAASSDGVSIDVVDDGTTIPQQELDALQSGRETDLTHVSGLGLWLIHEGVTKSGGRVEFRENSPTGTIVHIELPT